MLVFNFQYTKLFQKNSIEKVEMNDKLFDFSICYRKIGKKCLFCIYFVVDL
jgi:hypothetical protein